MSVQALPFGVYILAREADWARLTGSVGGGDDRQRQPRRDERDDGPPGKPGEWNGPVPGFLDIGFG